MNILRNLLLGLLVLALYMPSATAQSDITVEVRFKDKTQSYNVGKTNTLEVSAMQLKSAEIHIFSKEGEYAVQEYELSYLNNNRQLIGPFKIKGTNLSVAITDKKIIPEKGGRLFIDDIKAVCNVCSQDKNISRLMAINVQ